MNDNNHVASVQVYNSHAIFKNSSRDSFANGVTVTNNGHTAVMWIDDTDADVSITAELEDGTSSSISIGTNGYEIEPYLLIEGESCQLTHITHLDGITAIIPA